MWLLWILRVMARRHAKLKVSIKTSVLMSVAVSGMMVHAGVKLERDPALVGVEVTMRVVMIIFLMMVVVKEMMMEGVKKVVAEVVITVEVVKVRVMKEVEGGMEVYYWTVWKVGPTVKLFGQILPLVGDPAAR